MSTKKPRTKLHTLPAQPQALDLETLADVVGGLKAMGGAGPFGGTAGCVSTWTWTAPACPDDIYRKDDE